MKNTVNAHIYPSPMTHESRIFKQANSIHKLAVFEQIWLIGVLTEGLAEEEFLSDNIIIKRVNVDFFGISSKNNLLTYFIFYAKIFWMLLFQKVKMLNVHNLELLPLGAVLKFFKRCVLIYDPHELETEKSSLGATRRKILIKIEKNLIGYADKVFVVGEAIADCYLKCYPQERPVVVLNCPNTSKVEDKSYFRNHFDISMETSIYLCQGRLGKHRGIEMVIDAFSKINDQSKCVVFLGDGDLSPYVKEAAINHHNIFYHPPVHPDVLLNYTASADVGLALIEDISFSYRLCMPNKIFEYLMAGLPIVVSDLPEMRNVVTTNKVGMILKPYTSKALLELILKNDFSDIRHANIIAASTGHYNWQVQEAIMLKEYRQILGC